MPARVYCSRDGGTRSNDTRDEALLRQDGMDSTCLSGSLGGMAGRFSTASRHAVHQELREHGPPACSVITAELPFRWPSSACATCNASAMILSRPRRVGR